MRRAVYSIWYTPLGHRDLPFTSSTVEGLEAAISDLPPRAPREVDTSAFRTPVTAAVLSSSAG